MDYRKFPARITDQGPDTQTGSWITARFNGFLQTQPPAEQLGALAAAWQDGKRTLHAIYDLVPGPSAALSHEVPVATLATFEAGLNAGGGADVPCTLVADVTVRPTHQGRGLMRRLMQAAMQDASDTGVPLMALHAAHPALYERFGFAPAIRSASVEVDCSRFSLRRRTAGVVHEANTRDADEVARTVATAANPFGFGALAVPPPPSGRSRRQGNHGERCLIHADDGGNIDGVLTYAFRGWTPHAQILDVLSETYSTVNAHAALWQTLASTGIATTVQATDVRIDDPLPWMITDRAAWRFTALTDGLSLRILDPAFALRSRGYSCPDSKMVVEVVDAAGPAAGSWLVRVEDRRADVTEQFTPPDVTLDSRELAAIYLGATRTTALLDAGLISASRSAAETLDRILSSPIDAMSAMHF